MNHALPLLTGLLLAPLAALGAAQPPPPARPNIIFILAAHVMKQDPVRQVC